MKFDSLYDFIKSNYPSLTHINTLEGRASPQELAKYADNPNAVVFVYETPKRRNSQKQRPPNLKLPPTPPVNVLIVEDNPINQAILKTFLTKKKIKFDVASNGREAVDKWKEGRFHLVLMDIQLPVMSGIDATKEIRHIERRRSNAFTPPVVIVALTASSLPEDRHEALTAGCNDFLTKPVNLSWLEKKIEEWGSMQALIDFMTWSATVSGGTPTERNVRMDLGGIGGGSVFGVSKRAQEESDDDE